MDAEHQFDIRGIALPVSAVYGAYASSRNRISFHLNSAPAKHDARVINAVIRQIVDWKNQGAG